MFDPLAYVMSKSTNGCGAHRTMVVSSMYWFTCHGGQRLAEDLRDLTSARGRVGGLYGVGYEPIHG